MHPCCWLKFQVKVGPNVTVKPGSLLTDELVKEADDWGESGEEDIPGIHTVLHLKFTSF